MKNSIKGKNYLCTNCGCILSIEVKSKNKKPAYYIHGKIRKQVPSCPECNKVVETHQIKALEITRKQKTQTIIKFLKIKNKIINEICGIEYVNKKDLKGIHNFTDENIDNVYINIIKSIKCKFRGIPDSYICPWCLVYWSDCSNCTYSTYHGECGEIRQSTYSDIVMACNEYLVDMCIRNNRKFNKLLK